MNKSQKINIEVDKSVSVDEALSLVRAVVADGPVSEAAGIKHYCWVTTWRGENISGKEERLVVSTRRKKTKTSADSFYVYSEKIKKPNHKE
jgi:hypothetical protein